MPDVVHRQAVAGARHAYLINLRQPVLGRPERDELRARVAPRVEVIRRPRERRQRLTAACRVAAELAPSLEREQRDGAIARAAREPKAMTPVDLRGPVSAAPARGPSGGDAVRCDVDGNQVRSGVRVRGAAADCECLRAAGNSNEAGLLRLRPLVPAPSRSPCRRSPRSRTRSGNAASPRPRHRSAHGPTPRRAK